MRNSTLIKRVGNSRAQTDAATPLVSGLTLGVVVAFALIIVLMLQSTAYAELKYGVTDGKVPLMELEEVTDLIMSPGCKYLYTLSLCPSEEAKQMREIVKDKLSVGESTDEILNYFEEIYGPRVLARPARKGFYFMAWWFPYFLLLDVIVLGGIVLFIWRRRQVASAEAEHVGTEGEEALKQEEELDAMLEDEIRRFKEE